MTTYGMSDCHGPAADDREKAMYRIGPYNPFPPELKGPFCEIPLADGTHYRWIEIYYRDCSMQKIEELRSRGEWFLENSGIPEWLSKAHREPSLDLFWIYRLDTYIVSGTHQNLENFVDASEEYESMFFGDFNDLIKYCEMKYKVAIENFQKKENTNYPKY
ncbi:hypothetical protein KXS07_05030 [Inquilinus limosus]|uniref:hypothetical protein n=1 Tax=Inquilinus limosus TaxID=171674 RepID=UPI003F150972